MTPTRIPCARWYRAGGVQNPRQFRRQVGAAWHYYTYER